MRKLTVKCEEWEVSYDKQLKIIEMLQAKHGNTHRKASQLAHKRSQLEDDVQTNVVLTSHNPPR